MIRQLVTLPDHVLKVPAEPIEVIDADAIALARDLVDTMQASPGCVGLAAPQIGVSRRVFCVDVTGHKKAGTCHGLVVMLNPELLLAHGPVVAREGCMSVPELTGDVARATLVVVRGTAPDGRALVVRADAFEARALLHELDHLDGLLFLDRVVSADAVFKRKVYR